MAEGFMLTPAAGNWQRFITVFNRCTVYAPYTARLSMGIVKEHIACFDGCARSFASIGACGKDEGIIHSGTYILDNGQEIGLIYMLLADGNKVARLLLESAEEWFRSGGIREIFAYWGFPSPYKYILHGAETYAWGGAYPTVNAFDRLGYDVSHDVLVMTAGLAAEPEVIMPGMRGLQITERPCEEDDLAWSVEAEVLVQGKMVGSFGFQHLKAVSRTIRREIGQFHIDLDPAFHGTGLSTAMITYAHKRLYGRGVRKVILATNQGLFRAIKFYEKSGYKAEVIKGYFYTKELETGNGPAVD